MIDYIYLATPYSHKSARIRCERFWKALQKAADIMQTGQAVFCPIAHSHPIAEHIEETQVHSFDFWMQMDLPILRGAKELWVCQWDGWKESRGIQREIEEAEKWKIPIRYLDQ